MYTVKCKEELKLSDKCGEAENEIEIQYKYLECVFKFCTFPLTLLSFLSSLL